MDHDYIRTARSKGIAGWKVFAKHTVRNAAVPVATMLGLQAGRVLGGAIVVGLLAMPGFGTLMADTVPAVISPCSAAVLVSGVVLLLVNLTVDISYGILDPRRRR